MDISWLVVSNMNFIFHVIYGMSSFPLTNSIIFQDGYCTTNQTPSLVTFQSGPCSAEVPVALHAHAPSWCSGQVSSKIRVQACTTSNSALIIWGQQP
jgi:hypothetical protein